MPVKIIPVRPSIVYRIIYNKVPESDDGKDEDIAERILSQKTAIGLFPSLYKLKTSTRIVTIVTELKTVVSNSLTILAVPLAILKSSQ